MLHAQLAAVMLALVALAVSGCGSSKSGSTTSASNAATTGSSTTAPSTTPTTTSSVKIVVGKPLSLARWVAAGDTVCKRVQSQLASVSVHNRAQFKRGLPQAAIIYANETEDLSKIVPPTASAHDWETYVNDVHVYDEYTNIVLHEFNTGRTTISLPIQRKLLELQNSEVAIAKRYGFKWCTVGE